MSNFKKVVVVGKGFLGSAIVEQLAVARFEVTVLGRSPGSMTGLPVGVRTVQVDYESPESLVAALRGQDVVVCTIGTNAVKLQTPIIDAAIEAGIRRFVPSDFGGFMGDPKAQQTLKFLRTHAFYRKYLAEKAEDGVLEFTTFASGGFLDMVFTVPFLVDFNTRSARLYGSGTQPVSVTSVATIGKAVAAALSKPEASKNRNIFIHEAVVSQVQILALAKKHSTAPWVETSIDGEAAYQAALAAAGDDDFNETTSYPLLLASLLTGKFASAYKQVDNDWLGLGYLSDEEIEARVAAACK